MRLFTLVLAGMMLWQGASTSDRDRRIPIVTDAVQGNLEVIWTSRIMEQDWPGKYLWERYPEQDGKFNPDNPEVNAIFPRAWRRTKYSCPVKSDFLLTSEDDTKHVCVRFQ